MNFRRKVLNLFIYSARFSLNWVLKGFATFWEFSFYRPKKVADYEYHILFAEKIHFHTFLCPQTQVFLKKVANPFNNHIITLLQNHLKPETSMTNLLICLSMLPTLPHTSVFRLQNTFQLTFYSYFKITPYLYIQGVY